MGGFILKRFGTITAWFALLFNFSVVAFGNADDLNDWMHLQRRRSLQYMMANLSPADAVPGVIVAASSRKDPDYYYHWVRDAGIVVQSIVGEMPQASTDEKAKLAKFILEFVDFSRKNQLASTLTGLGEPKFNVNGEGYMGSWGRPQNDGPALRAIALIQLADVWFKAGKENWVRNKLYDGRWPTQTVIKADLEFVADHWRETCFDLWEEVKGVHFYSRMAQRRALIDGAWLADRLDDGGAAKYYRAQAALIETELLRHWDPSKGVLVPTIDRDAGIDYKFEGLDASVIIGALHGRTNDGFFSVTNDKMLATFAKSVDRFSDLYRVNKNNTAPGVAIGRYPEDKYNGGVAAEPEGNPWFLLTVGYGEFLLRSASAFEVKGSFSINSTNRRFFEWLRINSSHSVGDLTQALRIRANAFIERVRYHSGDDGHLPEQINRHSGFRQGAENLTWSYAAFLTAMAANDSLR